METKETKLGNEVLEVAKNVQNPNYIGLNPLEKGDICTVGSMTWIKKAACSSLIWLTAMEVKRGNKTFVKMLPFSYFVGKKCVGKDFITNRGTVVDAICLAANMADAFEAVKDRPFVISEVCETTIPTWDRDAKTGTLFKKGERSHQLLELNFIN